MFAESSTKVYNGLSNTVEVLGEDCSNPTWVVSGVQGGITKHGERKTSIGKGYEWFFQQHSLDLEEGFLCWGRKISMSGGRLPF